MSSILQSDLYKQLTMIYHAIKNMILPGFWSISEMRDHVHLLPYQLPSSNATGVEVKPTLINFTTKNTKDEMVRLFQFRFLNQYHITLGRLENLKKNFSLEQKTTLAFHDKNIKIKQIHDWWIINCYGLWIDELVVPFPFHIPHLVKDQQALQFIIEASHFH